MFLVARFTRRRRLFIVKITAARTSNSVVLSDILKKKTSSVLLSERLTECAMLRDILSPPYATLG